MSKEIMLEKKVWAVIGANQNPDKFGNKIYKRLKNKGYEVYPINPIYETIDGDISYKNLSSLPEVPDVINMVVAPEKGKSFIEEAAKLGVKYIWFQPGTFDKEVFQLVKNYDMAAIQACVLVATDK